MTEVTFVFGTKQETDLSEYPTVPGTPFIFAVTVAGSVSSYHSACILLHLHHDRFIQETATQDISTRDFCLTDKCTRIPTCYLTQPTIEVDGVELLQNGKQPNPWLSKTASA